MNESYGKLLRREVAVSAIKAGDGALDDAGPGCVNLKCSTRRC